MRRASIGAIARTQDRTLAWTSNVCQFCSWVTLAELAEGDLTDVDTEILNAGKKEAVRIPRSRREISVRYVSGTICAKHPKGQFLANGTGHLFQSDDRSVASGRCDPLRTDAAW